jgi:RNA polymerase sigma-70 factor (ECF subfamily)
MRDVSDLTNRAAQGDTAAFAELVAQYRGLVFSACFQRTGRWEDSEDLTQEVFVAAYRSLDSIREPGKFVAWLRGITENVCRMEMRRRKPPQAASVEDEVSPDWMKAAKSVEVGELLQQALAAIPPNSRDVVSLYYLGGYSYSEISQLRGLPVKTIKSRLHEARGQLKTQLLRAVMRLYDHKRAKDNTVRCVIERCGSKVCKCARQLYDS